MQPDKTKELIEALADEAKWLAARGYCFPALYEAIRFLLEQSLSSSLTEKSDGHR